MQLKHLKPIHILVKTAITRQKNQVGNFIFMIKMGISILKEYQRLKRTG